MAPPSEGASKWTRALPPRELIPWFYSSSGWTQRPEGSQGRGDRNCKQWPPGLQRSSPNPESESPDPEGGAFAFWPVPGDTLYSPGPVPPTPDSPQPRPERVWSWDSLSPPPGQTTRPTETPDPKLTQLAREKTPSTAPMVALVIRWRIRRFLVRW